MRGLRLVFLVQVLCIVGLPHGYAQIKPACSDLKLDEMCKTSKKKCFKMINDPALGISIQERGDDCKHEGTVWARQLQKTDVNDDAAERACPDGTRLPTKGEFVELRDSMGTRPNPYPKHYFDPSSNHKELSRKGRKELYSLLPDMEGHWLWSVSPIDDNSVYAFTYDGHLTDVPTGYDTMESVQCVRSAHEK